MTVYASDFDITKNSNCLVPLNQRLMLPVLYQLLRRGICGKSIHTILVLGIEISSRNRHSFKCMFSYFEFSNNVIYMNFMHL